MTTELLSEFIAALTDEIAAAKRKDEAAGTRLSMGTFIENTNGTFVYEFTTKRDLSTIESGALTQLETNGKRHDCTITAIEGKRIKLTISENIGSRVNLARLIQSQTALHQMLIDRFTDVLTKGSSQQFNFANAVFSGLSQKLCAAQSRGSINAMPERGANPSQMQAIANSFTKSLSIIWGPPGTGKTKTIARAVEAHLRAGRRVLLVSLANTAVDTALEAIAELLQESFYEQGQLLRLGVPRNTSLCQRFPLVIAHTQIRRKKEQLAEQKAILETQLSSAKSRIADCQSIMRLSEMVKACHRKSEKEAKAQATKFAESYNTAMCEIYRLTSQIGQAQQTLNHLESDAESRSMWEKKLKDWKILRASRQQIADEIRSKFNACCEKQKEQLKAACFQINQLVSETAIDPHAAPSLVLDLRRQIGITSSKLECVRTEEPPEERQILSGARLVATTLAKTFAGTVLDDEKFDVLIVDEASMAPMPQLYWALSKTTMSATIVGDFMQLPPIVQSQSQVSTKWLRRSIFEQLKVATIDAAKESPLISLLDTQYRMSPNIANVSSQLFYGGLVKNSESTEKLSFVDCLTNTAHSTIVIDTTDINPWCTQGEGKTNLESAALTVKICEQLKREHPEKSLGVATPYKAQAELITERLATTQFGATISVSTVHKFQGMESDIIIFDCVDGTGSRRSMLSDSNHNSTASVLLNVAMTRARAKFILIANARYFLNSIHSSGIFPRLLSILRDTGIQINSKELLEQVPAAVQSGPQDQLFAIAAEPPAESISLFNEVSFWDSFHQDLNEAQNTVCICSPYATRARAAQIIPMLTQLLENGLNITIYTRPPASHSQNMIEGACEVIDQLRQSGATVLERRNIHEKFAIIDGYISYTGSLNILSHRDTTEQMTRVVGTRIASKLVEALEEMDTLETMDTLKPINAFESVNTLEPINAFGPDLLLIDKTA